MVEQRSHPKLAATAAAVVAFTVALVSLVSFVGIDQATGAATAVTTSRRHGEATQREAPVPIESALVTRARIKIEEQFRQAQVAQYLAAVAEFYRPKTGVDWDGIAQCETGGNWSMQGSRFSGGVGFYNGTWTGFGGRQFAPNAGMATKAEQIIVAERVYARHGLSGWGCKAYG